MESNPILAEIRATRDRLAREAGYDVQKLVERIRRRESEEAARGERLVSLAEPESSIVHEEPPKG